jgi:hypothetical protein
MLLTAVVRHDVLWKYAAATSKVLLPLYCCLLHSAVWLVHTHVCLTVGTHVNRILALWHKEGKQATASSMLKLTHMQVPHVVTMLRTMAT